MNFLKYLIKRFEFRLKKYKFTIIHRLGNGVIVIDVTVEKRTLQDAYEYIYHKWPNVAAVERRRFL
jgi:hypothetical protein